MMPETQPRRIGDSGSESAISAKVGQAPLCALADLEAWLRRQSADM